VECFLLEERNIVEEIDCMRFNIFNLTERKNTDLSVQKLSNQTNDQEDSITSVMIPQGN